MNNAKYLRFSFLSYLVFLVWPLGALIFGIFNYKNPHFKNIILLFCAFYGFNFIIKDESFDSAAYRDQLFVLYEMNYSFFDFIRLLWYGNYGRGDFFQPLITYFVSLFTNNYRILFLIFGLIYGFFLSRNIDMVINSSTRVLKNMALPLVILFIFLTPIWNINGIRFYLACNIFIYFLLKSFYDKKQINIFFSFLSCLVHFSFVFPSAILLGYYFIGNKRYIYFMFLVLSIFFIKINLLELIPFVPDNSSVLNERLSDYTHPDYIEYIQKGIQNEAWFLKWSNQGIIYLMILISFFLMMDYRNVKNLNLSYLFSIGVLLLAFAAIVQDIPSMGRFFILPFMLLSGIFIIYIQNVNRNRFLNFSLPFMLLPISLFVIVQVRFGLEFTTVITCITNPLIASFFDQPTTLLDIFYK